MMSCDSDYEEEYQDDGPDYCPECGGILDDPYACGRCWWRWEPPEVTLRDRVQHLLWWVAGMRFWPRRLRQRIYVRRHSQDLPF